MSTIHKWAVAGAVTAEILLLAGILLGYKVHLETWIGVNKTLREVCVALWVVAVPGWFTAESLAFAPDAGDQAKVKEFAKGQTAGQAIAALLGLIIFTAIGLSPTANPQGVTPAPNAQTSSPTTASH